MFFARFFALFLFFAVFGIASSVPSVTAVQKRQDITDIEGVFNTLKSSTDTILPQITSAGQSGNASAATVTPLINELTAAFNTASSSLASLRTSNRKARRQSEPEISLLVAGIVTDVTQSLDTLLADLSIVPEIAPLLAGVDVALNATLAGLEILLAGVLTLVSVLLVNVSGLLESLSFGLTLASLGL